MKTKLALAIAAVFAFLALGMLFTGFQSKDDFELSKREILMRKIGHEILLHSGDSTSRVLPVTNLGNEKYQLVFEKQFTFVHDTLVAIVRHTLDTQDESNYMVKVLDCSSAAVVYGYTISGTQKDVLACGGRTQPTGCYLITIEFEDPVQPSKKYTAAASLLVIAVLLPLVIGRRHRKKIQPESQQPITGLINIGALVFDPGKKQLVATTETLKLTAKENRLLLIFAQNPNQVIDRARLQKEIWEDDGVIVGRSLDVFISKLRKKLESEPMAQLVNIHGKGYKLQIGAPEI